MPLVTTASAISLISFSLTSQPNLFQLFQPMGGVRANPFSKARAGAKAKRKHAASQRVVFFITCSVFEAMAPSFLPTSQGLQTSRNYRPDFITLSRRSGRRGTVDNLIVAMGRLFR